MTVVAALLPMLTRADAGRSESLIAAFLRAYRQIERLKKTPPNRRLYFGRTGDSSSANAASPFSRIGQHLDLRSNAKGNSLARQLHLIGIAPAQCMFEMLAMGPFFPEQNTFESHKPFRDAMSALESALADTLSDRGYKVIGTHGRRARPDGDLFPQVLRHINSRFPVLQD